jgi:hypothetical protein
MTQDSHKPKPQASKGSDIHNAALDYLKMLRKLDSDYDVKGAVKGGVKIDQWGGVKVDQWRCRRSGIVGEGGV